MSGARRFQTLACQRCWSERILSAGLWMTAIAISGVFACVIGQLVIGGAQHIDLAFLLDAPAAAGVEGGILPILVSTLLILLVALTVSLPLGVGTAIWLAEFSRRDRWVKTVVGRSLDVLAAVPSIVFGLFGNALFCNLLGMGYSIMAGGLTLACMVLPILIRALETGFGNVPDDYRVAAAALGMSRTRTVFSILLPVAAPGLLVGLVLGIGRVLAETAALLFTSGYVDRMPGSLLDSGRALSVHIYDLTTNVAGGEPNAYASALVLVMLLLVINWTAIWCADHWLSPTKS